MKDGFPKKGLVVEGGGIRSAFVAGVLLALHDKGLNHFDVITGTSAGACCAANFMAGEPEKNKIILENYLTGSRFVRFGKIFSKENIVDIDYLIDDICGGIIPMNFEKVKKSATKLYITATDYQSGQTAYFDNRHDDIAQALRASCAMPYLYRKKVFYKNRRYLDGGMTVAIPVEKAIEEGCSEIVVIGSRTKGYRKSPDKIPAWIHSRVYSDSPVIVKTFRDWHVTYNRELDLIQNPPAGVTIHYIAPEGPMPVTRTTRDPAKVKEGIQLGYQTGIDFVKNYSNVS